MTTAKLLGSMRVKLRVALASTALLVIGTLIAPRAIPTALSPPEERAAPLLEEQTQARDLARTFTGVQQVRTRIADIVVAIVAESQEQVRTSSDYGSRPEPIRPSGFGVVVAATGEVLSHADALAGRIRVPIDAGDGNIVNAEVIAYEPDTGLIILSAPLGGLAPLVPDFAAAPQPGALAAGYGRWASRETVVPVFVSSVSAAEYSIVTPESAIAPGMPIYTLEGKLLAIAGASDAGNARPAGDAAARLMARVRDGIGLPSSLGVMLQSIDEPLAALLGDTGVLVADVMVGSPAASAGIQPGDVIVAIAAIPIGSVESAQRAIAALARDRAVTVSIRRGARAMTVSVTPSDAYSLSIMPLGSGAPTARSVLRAGEVLTAVQRERAGLNEDAMILSINGRPAPSPAVARRELRRARMPALLHVEHDGRRFFTVVER